MCRKPEKGTAFTKRKVNQSTKNPSKMIIYNVTINIDESVENQWLDYMKNRHIPDVLKTGCFVKSSISRLLTRQADETGVSYAIQYHCENIDQYNRYEKEFAPRLQKEHSELYGGKFVAFRTLMEEV